MIRKAGKPKGEECERRMGVKNKGGGGGRGVGGIRCVNQRGGTGKGVRLRQVRRAGCRKKDRRSRQEWSPRDSGGASECRVEASFQSCICACGRFWAAYPSPS